MQPLVNNRPGFRFEVPISFFEKAGAPAGRARRIGGIVSTETPDRQGDIVLQRGLNFEPFVRGGWFNDNHSKLTRDILGYPDNVRMFQKGEKLPDGSHAPARGHWVEGWLLDTQDAAKVWELGHALQKSGRRLGFSVEGSIDKRVGPGKKIVAEGTVRNVAVTGVPVNEDTNLVTLAKSLMAVERGDDLGFPAPLEEQIATLRLEFMSLRKALGMGAESAPPTAPVGPQTGMGAGQVITPQSLEGKQRDLFAADDEDEKRKRKLTKSEAEARIRERLGAVPPHVAEKIIHLASLRAA